MQTIHLSAILGQTKRSRVQPPTYSQPLRIQTINALGASGQPGPNVQTQESDDLSP